VVVVVATDEEQTVATRNRCAIRSRLGQETYQAPLQCLAVDACGVYTSVIPLRLTCFGEVATASHNEIVANLTGITCRHTERITWFGRGKTNNAMHVLRREWQGEEKEKE